MKEIKKAENLRDFFVGNKFWAVFVLLEECLKRINLPLDPEDE